MTSSNFGFGEQSKIASAYAQIYAPKSEMNESCCKAGCGKNKKTVKKPVKEACCNGGLVTKHVAPKKTGSKLGARKMMEFKKRDAKPCCGRCVKSSNKVDEAAGTAGLLIRATEPIVRKFLPKNNSTSARDILAKGKEELKNREVENNNDMKISKTPITALPSAGGVAGVVDKQLFNDNKANNDKVNNAKNESASTMRGFCITDGNKTLCTNDVNESYFSKEGITGETRIYESAVSALKDIKKVNARRKPNSKYCIRKCECVGESFQFVQSGTKVDESQNVNEGLWDGLKSIGSGIVDAGKAVGNVAGGTLKGVGNLAQGNFSQAGSDFVGGIKDAAGNVVDAGKNLGSGVLDTTTGAASTALGAAKGAANLTGGVAKAVGNTLQGNFAQAASDLKQGASGALDDVVDGANSEASGEALLNGAKEGAKAVGNTIAAPLNAVGGVAKAAGNTLQGNFAQAGSDLVDGAKAAGQKLVDAKNNVVNAATNTNDEQKKKEAEAAAAKQQPPTAAQNTAMANGAGPVTDAAAQNNPAVKDATQKEQIKQDATNAAAPAAPDSVRNYMNDNAKAPAQNTAAQQQGGNDQKKQQIQKQIEELQKQLQSLG